MYNFEPNCLKHQYNGILEFSAGIFSTGIGCKITGTKKLVLVSVKP